MISDSGTFRYVYYIFSNSGFNIYFQSVNISRFELEVAIFVVETLKHPETNTSRRISCSASATFKLWLMAIQAGAGRRTHLTLSSLCNKSITWFQYVWMLNAQYMHPNHIWLLGRISSSKQSIDKFQRSKTFWSERDRKRERENGSHLFKLQIIYQISKFFSFFIKRLITGPVEGNSIHSSKSNPWILTQISRFNYLSEFSLY